MHMRLSMDMRTFSPEFHVAQQGRRDKLRIQQDSNPLSRCVPNSDPIPGDNIISYTYNPSGIYPETTTSNLYSTTTNPPVPPCFSTWKSIGTERSSWVPANRTPISVGEDKNCTNPANTTASTVYQKALSLSLSSDTSSKFSAGNGVVTQSLTHRYPGPLGPFTGYASILRSSKFLMPAHQILEDLCFVARSRQEQACGSREQISEEVRVCGGDYGVAADGIGGDSSGSSSHVENGRSDRRRETGGAGAAAAGYCRPEKLQTKAKLLYMQDEASKRYKQYQQQMQMVVSSFESVAGLNTATPYVSVAIKTVGKHFRCLKNSIADHLKSLRNVLGEDSPAPSAGSKAESVFKFFENGFPMPKGTRSSNILDGQHIWRPQRGLPERAVSILRAWLFDHFLHPYPTDTDKHMLASQTGLTRNQVSNWFINARVRLWKPMVEEIHMLETKGLAGETGPDNTRKAAVTTSTSAAFSDSRQSFNRTSISISGQDKQVEQQSTIIGLHDQHGPNADGWNPDKRSRIEYHHDPTAVVGGRSLMGYGGSRFEMAGPGAVSLTLGLRQSAENGHLAPPLLAGNHHHLRQHFGGQLIRDFVG